MDQTAFMIGFAVMSLASLAIYVTGNKTPPSRHHTLLHATVPFIAATAYLAMAFGIGTFVGSDGSATYFARYADWSVTTPILLSGLVLTAFHDRGRTGEVGGYLTSIIVLDAKIPHDLHHPARPRLGHHTDKLLRNVLDLVVFAQLPDVLQSGLSRRVQRGIDLLPCDLCRGLCGG